MILDSSLIIGIRGQLNQGKTVAGPMVLVLGIRPDIIRASIIIRELRSRLGNNFKLIWSGQHYSENLKDIFFSELNVSAPDIELNIKGDTDSQLVSDMILKLGETFQQLNPSVAVFLGDTNTVTGTIAAGQLNIPIVHIEGCMRSYDWTMPEEKYRTIADHLSDYIYAYLDEYKNQGVAEGIPSQNIIVTGNPIVDVLEEYFLSNKLRMAVTDLRNLLNNKYAIHDEPFYFMTCHRRENIENENAIKRILSLAENLGSKVIFPAGYRTQKQIKKYGVSISKQIILVDPIGYLELLELINKSQGVLTDSGTIIEETSILGIPSIQMRKSTERPQVYNFGSAIKFDPFGRKNINDVIHDFRNLKAKSWKHEFGDGKASYRIVDDLVERYSRNDFNGHEPSKKEPYSLESYKS